MANRDLPPGALAKPARGTTQQAALARSDARLAHERRQKAIVRRRDPRCRRPGCPHCAQHHGRLRLDCAHLSAKGLGGDPQGRVTTAAQMIRLDLISHGEQERGLLIIVPLDPRRGTAGPCEFYWSPNGSTGDGHLEGIG
ncbi:MAG TPA: hypothetical protein VKE26_26230 [Xanthobacteraceae bacterium]|nr:hypothetical protein [Xanthobacteraceae bacterium]